MMLKVLVYAYSVGVFSSRKIERRLYEDVAFRYLSAGQFPNHRTICRFRERHLDDVQLVFAQVVRVAQQAGLVRMGTLAIDGTKVKANASKHKAMSYERMKSEEKRLRAEIRAITKMAQDIDAEEDAEFGPDFRGDELPEELQKRETRRQAIRDAIKRLEERKRKAAPAPIEKDAKSKKRLRGRPRKHPLGKPKPKDQENFTDPDSRIMKVGSGAFEQCYNAQASVDGEDQIIVATGVTQCAADSGQLLPMLDEAKRITKQSPGLILADAGYRSEENFRRLERRRVSALVSLGREGKSPPPPRATHAATKRMYRRLATKRGRRRYRERKHIVEPAFGWIKNVLGFRGFSLRGHKKVSGEWALVCLATNLRRMNQTMAWI